jgi:hypothetical protein
VAHLAGTSASQRFHLRRVTLEILLTGTRAKWGARGRATFRSCLYVYAFCAGRRTSSTQVLSEISCAASAKAKYVISCGGKSQLSSDNPARIVVSPELYGGGKLNGETVRADYHDDLAAPSTIRRVPLNIYIAATSLTLSLSLSLSHCSETQILNGNYAQLRGAMSP